MTLLIKDVLVGTRVVMWAEPSSCLGTVKCGEPKGPPFSATILEHPDGLVGGNTIVGWKLGDPNIKGTAWRPGSGRFDPIWEKCYAVSPDSACEIMQEYLITIAKTSSEIVNDHTCSSCGNNRCSKTEKSCWLCGAAIVTPAIMPATILRTIIATVTIGGRTYSMSGMAGGGGNASKP